MGPRTTKGEPYPHVRGDPHLRPGDMWLHVRTRRVASMPYEQDLGATLTHPDPAAAHGDGVESITGGWEPRRVFEVVLGVPATDGNRVTVLRNGDQIFPAMLDAIGAGEQHSIDFLTFVYWTGEIAGRFAEALARACASRCSGPGAAGRTSGLGAWTTSSSRRCAMPGASSSGSGPSTTGDAGRGRPPDAPQGPGLRRDGRVHRGGRHRRGVDRRRPRPRRVARHPLRGTRPAVDGLRAAFLGNWAETGHDAVRPGVDRWSRRPPAGRSAVQVVADGDEHRHSATALAFRI